MVDKLNKKGKVDFPSGMYYQIYGGPGTLNPNWVDPNKKEGGLGALPMGPKTAPPGGTWEDFPNFEGKEAGGPMGGKLGSFPPKAGPIWDWDGYQIQKDLQEVLFKTHQNSHHARFLNRNVAHAARMHNVGWRSAADLLKYPGAPVEP